MLSLTQMNLPNQFRTHQYMLIMVQPYTKIPLKSFCHKSPHPEKVQPYTKEPEKSPWHKLADAVMFSLAQKSLTNRLGPHQYTPFMFIIAHAASKIATAQSGHSIHVKKYCYLESSCSLLGCLLGWYIYIYTVYHLLNKQFLLSTIGLPHSTTPCSVLVLLRLGSDKNKLPMLFLVVIFLFITPKKLLTIRLYNVTCAGSKWQLKALLYY